MRLIDDFDYDLVIFGDVLEHMTEEDAVKLWNKVSKQARAAIIAIPIIQYPQGAHGVSPTNIALITMAILISQRDIFLSSRQRDGFTRLSSLIGSALHSGVPTFEWVVRSVGRARHS